MVPKYSKTSEDSNGNVVHNELASPINTTTTTTTTTTNGIKELLYENYYYDVTEWIKKHPGGKIIEYYTENGEDATIAIEQFHQRSTKKVMSIMNTMKKRLASKEEMNIIISPQRKSLTEDFMKLYKDLLDEGMFNRSIPHVALRITELMTLMAIGLYFTSMANIFMRILGMVCIAMSIGRAGWLQHEGGHNSLTGNSKVDKFIQKFIMGFWYGMSASWWINQHNRHHAMPQRLQRDVDLETLPLLAFNSKVVKKPKDGISVFVQYQAYLFLTIDTFLIPIFWKLYLHPRYVIIKRQYIELIFMASNYYLLYCLGIYNYLILLWFASVYSLGNFSLSHTHLPVTKDPLHWVEYSLYHTTNIEPSWWCDWWMGYLNYQIEHHLFPTMPQFRHAKISPRIKELALKHNIPYKCESYCQAVIHTITNLHNVSKELNH